MYFLCSFSKFLHYFTKILYINTSISKILVAGLERTTITRLYAIRPSWPHYEFMILFDFHAPSVKSFNQKRRHTGIRIFIRHKLIRYAEWPFEIRLSIWATDISFIGYRLTSLQWTV